MKNQISEGGRSLRSLAVGLAAGLIMFSCSEDVEKANQNCQVLKFGNFAQKNYDSVAYNADGTVASVTWKQAGGSQRFDYTYEAGKISIYKTDLLVNHDLVCTVGLDPNGRPISRTEGATVYERYVYTGDRLDHILWPTKDSIVMTYEGAAKNPRKSEFYQYDAGTKTWSKLNTTTFTFDEKPNPLKGLILPIENWNMEAYFFENNRTSYSGSGQEFILNYTYNSDGYPISRTLTFTGFSEATEFGYSCN